MKKILQMNKIRYVLNVPKWKNKSKVKLKNSKTKTQVYKMYVKTLNKLII